MNTVRSFWAGWASVCLAGAGAYYFAKKEINADRIAKQEQYRRDKQNIKEMEYGLRDPKPLDGQESATPREPVPDGDRSSLQGTSTYRSRRGDRFS